MKQRGIHVKLEPMEAHWLPQDPSSDFGTLIITQGDEEVLRRRGELRPRGEEGLLKKAHYHLTNRRTM